MGHLRVHVILISQFTRDKRFIEVQSDNAIPLNPSCQDRKLFKLFQTYLISPSPISLSLSLFKC